MARKAFASHLRACVCDEKRFRSSVTNIDLPNLGRLGGNGEEATGQLASKQTTYHRRFLPKSLGLHAHTPCSCRGG